MSDAGSTDDLKFQNYALAFLDLLGQKEAYGEEIILLPNKENAEELTLFKSIVQKTVYAVDELQRSCEEFYEKHTNPKALFEEFVPEAKREAYHKIRNTVIGTQRWSDGYVAFVPLGNFVEHIPLNGLWGLLSTSGTICLLNLAKKQPVRGGIEVAWGIELKEGEINGCVAAKAYELESQVAQYPRIVVGSYLIEYLQSYLSIEEKDEVDTFNKIMARNCLDILAVDEAGCCMIDFLGEAFAERILKGRQKQVVQMAYEFVLEEMSKHRENGDQKLSMRYSRLRDYFVSSIPELS